MTKLTKKKLTKIKKELTAEEKWENHWEQAEERSKEIIEYCLERNLPINVPYQSIDFEASTNWRIIARDEVPATYQDYYEEATPEKLPEVAYLAHEIAYHYLLTILKRFIDDLSEYDCHDLIYFENLTNYEENY